MKWWLLILRLVVGGVFLYAGAIKIIDPAAFAKDIGNYRMLPHEWVNLLALTLPWVEAVSGGLLMVGIWKRTNALLIGFLLIIFMAAIGQAIARDLNIECGCFGTKGGRRTGLVTMVQDIFLFVGTAWIVRKETD
jgi:uncharacterized membrane protein YphA (DoxX/SURF4 family)